MFPKRLLVVIASVIWLSGCAHTAGDVAQPQPRTGVCQAGSAQNTPPQLYAMMVDCVQQQNYAQATQLYALAGSYSRYDALRIATPLARQQHNLMLSQALHQLEPEQRDTFWQLLRPALEDRSALAATCKNVKQTGVPEYSQNYFNDPQWSAANNGDRQHWLPAVNGYLHCP